MTFSKPLLATASALGLMMAAACTEASDSGTVAEYVTPAGQAEQFAEAGDLDTDTMETEGEVQERAETTAAEPDSDFQFGERTMADAASAAQSEYIDEAQAVMPEVEAMPREVFRLASDQIEASRLIGASLVNGSGDEIAEVADVWLGEGRGEVALLVRNGGLLGFGGDLHRMSFSDVEIVPASEAEGELIVRTASSELDELPAFEQERANDYRLASEVLGSIAPVSFSGESARVNELILTEDGELRYAVISPGIVSPEPLVVDGGALTVSEGDGEGALLLNVSEEDLAEAPTFPVI